MANSREHVVQAVPRAYVIVHVPRRHETEGQLVSDFREARRARGVSPYRVAPDFDEEPLGAEEITIPAGPFARLGERPCRKQTPPAARKHDEPLLAVHQSIEGQLGVMAVGGGQVRLGEKPAQVGITRGRLGKESDVGAVVERQLCAGDCLELDPFGELGERHRAVEPVVIGQGDGRIAESLGLLGEFLGQRGAVEKGEGGVAVEVDVHTEHKPKKRTCAICLFSPWSPRPRHPTLTRRVRPSSSVRLRALSASLLAASACAPVSSEPPPAPDIGVTCGVDPDLLAPLVDDRLEYVARSAALRATETRWIMHVTTVTVRFTIDSSGRQFDRRLMIMREFQGPRTGDSTVFSRSKAIYRRDDLRLLSLDGRYYRGSQLVAIDTAWSMGDTLLVSRLTDLIDSTKNESDSLDHVGAVWGWDLYPVLIAAIPYRDSLDCWGPILTERGHELGRFRVVGRGRAVINISQVIETYHVATPMGRIAVAAEEPHMLVQGFGLELKVRQKTLLRRPDGDASPTRRLNRPP